jgi:hypothetical protein
MKKEQNLQELQKQALNIPIVSGSYCEWKRCDFGMMGIHDYEYVTTCGKNYDCDKVKKENYCPNCGGKIV